MYDKLRGRIVERYGTQTRFAEALGIPKQTVSRKLTGQAGITQKDIRQWADLLKVSKADYWKFFFE